MILLGAGGGQMGCPSAITDGVLLQLVMPKPKKFPEAEERRLFYVAMTRARHSFTAIGSEARPSVFLEELIKETEYEVELLRLAYVGARCRDGLLSALCDDL